MDLTVQIATKLNRSHLFNGKIAYLLPCLGRSEIDRQLSGPQIVTVEDSTSCIHSSRGQVEPAGSFLLSEVAIVAGIAKATLPKNERVPWSEWVDDYARIREAIAETYPEIFADFNARLDEPGGFPKPLPARDRVWKTPSGRAEFKVPQALSASFAAGAGAGVLRLITLRSNDQFNTTVYGYEDRFRGISGTRMVVFMNVDDMAERDIADRQLVAMETAAHDGIDRRMAGSRLSNTISRAVAAQAISRSATRSSLWQHAEKSLVPAAKSVPVRVMADTPS